MASSASNPVPTGTVFTIAIPWLENKDRATGHTIDEAFVIATLAALELGDISKVDLIARGEQTEPKFKRAHQKGFVHFGSLTPSGEQMKEHLQAPAGEDGKQNEIKVWYSADHYWKARKSNFEYKSAESPTATFKPRVEF